MNKRVDNQNSKDMELMIVLIFVVLLALILFDVVLDPIDIPFFDLI
jgi:hypothetical protein